MCVFNVMNDRESDAIRHRSKMESVSFVGLQEEADLVRTNRTGEESIQQTFRQTQSTVDETRFDGHVEMQVHW